MADNERIRIIGGVAGCPSGPRPRNRHYRNAIKAIEKIKGHPIKLGEALSWRCPPDRRVR